MRRDPARPPHGLPLPKQLYDELTCSKDRYVFAEADGGGEHCHEGALALWHQRAFDWLDSRFSR